MGTSSGRHARATRQHVLRTGSRCRRNSFPVRKKLIFGVFFSTFGAPGTALNLTETSSGGAGGAAATENASWLGGGYIGQLEPLARIKPLVMEQILKRRISDAPLSLLLLGPSGVGKTELARKLAEQIHCGTGGATKNCNIKHLTHMGKFVEFKMGNYRSEEQFTNWIGVPDGVKGGDGHLSDTLVRNPDAVIYLDEIEKSISAAGDLLISMLDNKGSVQVRRGFSSDSPGRGRRTDFSSFPFFASCSITTAAHRVVEMSMWQYWHRVVFLWTMCTTHAGWSLEPAMYSPRQWERGNPEPGSHKKKKGFVCVIQRRTVCCRLRSVPTGSLRLHAPKHSDKKLAAKHHSKHRWSFPCRGLAARSPHLAGSVFVKNREHEICARRRSPQRRIVLDG